MTLRSKLSTYFQNLGPKKKKALSIFGGVAVLLAILWVAVVATSGGAGKRIVGKERKPEYTILADHSPREVSVETLSARVKRLQDDFSGVKEALAQSNERLKTTADLLKAKSDELQKQNDRVDANTKVLADELAKTQERLALPLPSLEGEKRNSNGGRQRPAGRYPDGPSQTTPPGIPDGNQASPDNALKIRITTASGNGNQGRPGADGKDGKKPDTDTIKKVSQIVTDRNGNKKSEIYIPAGSIMSGVLLTGLDAPSSNQARRDPFPSVLRIKHDTILPNRFRMDFRECFLISSGYGDLSSERAYMRAEVLSCVKTDGAILETPIDGFAVGEDGKAGVRGRLVSRNGQVIANSLLAGFVAGISQAFVPQRVQSVNLTGPNGSGTAPFQYPSPEMIAGQGIAGGVRGSAQQIAMYYMDMARNIFPVIEIDAGRKVDFVLIRGAGLNKRNAGAGGRGGNASSAISGGLSGLSQIGTMGGGNGAGVLNNVGIGNNTGLGNMGVSTGYGGNPMGQGNDGNATGGTYGR
jgi:conjugal transfer pilus assembly protein TraB